MIRTVVLIAARIYIAYLALSLLVILPALNLLVPRYVQETFGRQLQTEIILFNPFNLSLEMRGARMPEVSGERFASLDRVAINLSMSSIWRPGLVLDALLVDQLFLQVVRVDDTAFNFSDLIPAADSQAAAAPATGPDAGLPAVTIHHLDFSAEKIAYTDQTRDEPFSTHLQGLDLHVQDLSTVLEEGRPYRIDAQTEDAGSLHWEGNISIPGARSEGRLRLSGISLHPAWRFASPLVNFELRKAYLDVEAEYQVDWGNGLAYSISDGAISVSHIDIQPKSSQELPETAIALADITIAGVAVDGARQTAAIEQVTVTGLAVDGWSEADRVSLVELFAMDTNDAEAEAQEGDSGWSAELAKFRLADSRIHWRSEFTDPPLLQLSPVEVTVEDLRWPLAGETSLELALTANEQALVAIDGALSLASGDGSFSYQLQDLPLAWFNPNLPTALHGRITDGRLGLAGNLALKNRAPAVLDMTGAVSDFSGRVRDAELSLTSWDSVRWENLQLDMEQRSLAIQSVAIDNYSGRLHILEDGTINAQQVWQQQAAADAQTPPATAPQPEAAPAETPWSISIPTVRVTDSELDFMDESLPIHFRTLIGNLNGEITGISSAPGTEARVDMKGAVDGYAPVALRGTAQPFGDPPALDLSLTFDGVDLALLTPYSGTYAGYAIDRGLLNLDLQYSLQDSRLQGQNEILINKLKLGAKVDSDKALDLPLKLALALLTDMNGVIELSVPVSGDVNDPEFGLGSVIFKAFFNLIVKAVTAPFSLLASLVGSEEDLQHVNFGSGSSELGEAGRRSLQQLGNALAQRPALELVIVGRLHPRADRERLQELSLTAQLLAAGLSEDDMHSKGTAWEKAVQQRYLPLAGGEPVSPETPPLSPGQKYEAVLHSIAVDDAQLLELAAARAVASKDFLVNEVQLDPGRAVIEQARLEDEANLFSGVELLVDI